MKQAVVLVSGGLDSATTLAIARSEDYVCHALSFDYGQRHRVELVAASRITSALGAVQHKTIALDLSAIGGSALTDMHIEVPEQASEGIPVTYVPARNTVFLAVAVGWAEVLGAQDIFIGVNAVDYSGYPDCRPAFIAAFERAANLGTRVGAEGGKLKIHAPLIDWSKADIIRQGTTLGVNYAMTVSCYRADENGHACGHCDSCRLRRQGFQQAGLADPTVYY